MWAGGSSYVRVSCYAACASTQCSGVRVRANHVVPHTRTPHAPASPPTDPPQYSQKVAADAAATAQGYGTEIAWLIVAEKASRAALDVVSTSKHKLAGTVSTESAMGLLHQVRAEFACACMEGGPRA